MKKEDLKVIHQSILQWYEIYGRKELPWRNLRGENAPYVVYVSEVMLQQTQVTTVLQRYYQPFLDVFPTLEALSLGNEEEILFLWRGLGYYSRAKNMLKTAKICGKSLPSEPKELVKLPGIGEYTAGAIACFGFGKAVGFVDGNIKRVLSRFYALEKPSMKQLQQYSEKILNHQNSFDHNQALLDIGSTICVPLNPKCLICPLEIWCKGKNRPSFYIQKSKIVYENLAFKLGVSINSDKIGLIKSQVHLYKGLYNFPKILIEGILNFPFIGHIKHSYTHYRLDLEIYCVNGVDSLEEGVEFFSPDELKSLPMNAMTLKILALIEKKGIW
ncbi:A/G-specific adenine glycosylase [Helicobacter sp. 13S00477-4]|uniref:A/G-specific adenine glycosylase n=1 Tax=Helicobacter sp. 13S00477-4 TaxID=1905759 RepID=UPI000BA60A50|nr:A/G-specific adenine glycosylase [Helicobacter sp. 13S00477-4]PAF52142.1 A/G-specific adenine glycosylase [Helicobacter sp. 13S00477-4]